MVAWKVLLSISSACCSLLLLSHLIPLVFVELLKEIMAFKQGSPCPCRKFYEDVGVDADCCQECKEPRDNHPHDPTRRVDAFLLELFPDDDDEDQKTLN